MWTDDPVKSLETLKEISLEVGENLLKNYSFGGGEEIVGKGKDGTPTRRIDQFAENQLFDLLKKKGYNGSILSEERGYIKGEEKELLVIDPLDGTTNAIRGIPFYAISIALGKEREEDWLDAAEVGVVLELPLKRLYWAVKGSGAFRDGKKISVRETRRRDSIFSVFVGKGYVEEALHFLKRSTKIRYLGSAALEMCLVAEGALDLFVQLGTGIRTFDIAASSLILREAGGSLFAIERDHLYKPKMKALPTERRSIVAVGNINILKHIYPPLNEIIEV